MVIISTTDGSNNDVIRDGATTRSNNGKNSKNSNNNDINRNSSTSSKNNKNIGNIDSRGSQLRKEHHMKQAVGHIKELPLGLTRLWDSLKSPRTTWEIT